MVKNTSITIPNWVIEKMRNYCSYQERSMFDVTQKLKEYHLRDELIDKTILKLVEEGMLDEQRFSRIYTGGKIRINHWGRRKIRQKLFEKRVPELYVEIALQEVDEDEYMSVLKEIINKKKDKITENNQLKLRQKLFRFALSRGFEPHIINQALDS